MHKHDHNDPEHRAEMRANIEAARNDPRVVRAFAALGFLTQMFGFSQNGCRAAAEIMLARIAHKDMDPRAIDFLEDVALMGIDRYPDDFEQDIVRLMDGIAHAKVTIEKVYEQGQQPYENPVEVTDAEIVDVTDDEDDGGEYTGEYDDEEDDDV